jgi:hypothetical protein
MCENKLPEIRVWDLKTVLNNGRRVGNIVKNWTAQPRQCIFKEKHLFSVSITFV